jgi:hypothetical protein
VILLFKQVQIYAKVSLRAGPFGYGYYLKITFISNEIKRSQYKPITQHCPNFKKVHGNERGNLSESDPKKVHCDYLANWQCKNVLTCQKGSRKNVFQNVKEKPSLIPLIFFSKNVQGI